MKKAALLFVVLLTCSVLFAQQKFALVIGNANYNGISSLRNPVNDANEMETTLRALGFTVTKVLNGSRTQMETAVVNFKQRLRASNTYGFFFYAGHGIQSNGENYLIPVDANIPSENALRDRAVSLQWILAELRDAGNELNIVVLDSCRINPFRWSRSGTRGLTPVSHAPPGSIIFYATSDGRPAADGNGNNGLFTSHLLNSLKTPGLEINEVIRRTGAAVLEASGGTQIPAAYNQFFGIAYLGTRPSPGDGPSPTPTPQPTPNPTPTPQPNPNHIVNGLVLINGGTFTMGSPSSEPGRRDDEGPQHQVTVSSFYMGIHEVTQREYQEVMRRNSSSFRGDSLPVEMLAWISAVEYCNARSRLEGLTPAYTVNGMNVTWNRNANGYRLPTEAEWEYACRAGTTTAYNNGASINNDTGWYGGNSGRTTHSVGRKPANAWGLHDMHGNVSEWCWDMYEVYPSSALPPNQTSESSGSYHVVRGGSWSDPAQSVRSASRSRGYGIDGSGATGFRVARNAQ